MISEVGSVFRDVDGPPLGSVFEVAPTPVVLLFEAELDPSLVADVLCVESVDCPVVDGAEVGDVSDGAWLELGLSVGVVTVDAELGGDPGSEVDLVGTTGGQEPRPGSVGPVDVGLVVTEVEGNELLDVSDIAVVLGAVEGGKTEVVECGLAEVGEGDLCDVGKGGLAHVGEVVSPTTTEEDDSGTDVDREVELGVRIFVTVTAPEVMVVVIVSASGLKSGS